MRGRPFDRTVLLQLDWNSSRANMLLTVFDAIEMQGFHLLHASLDEQLLLAILNFLERQRIRDREKCQRRTTAYGPTSGNKSAQSRVFVREGQMSQVS
jgi:hypothetical protein